ncbi:hypothetical protein COU00_02010 [Candidatus Falkowbacteria bacterium CG10_big_fil_rev_8_21_14_0_10_43_11]|uniref:Sulfatase N-terminal domain-containing protein n=1 Tax=Candidatus Falkowbacteria bacterium CG10_big_fil_rev_8_21_14_0_10_43_11 TaxID=1974568 RepID=A0A2M6WM48_9BACT|nr:MAG: hypothetical protein COU00_02010 [Candidatus Falkowbacteria bacterium CG10_big_fil_rev_8_21_14_0_10_43_11]
MKKILFFHPALFAAASILFLYAHNQEQLAAKSIILPLVFALTAAAALFFLSRLIIRDSGKAALIVSLAVFLFFAYGWMYAPFESLAVNGFIIGRIRYFLPFYLGLFFVISYFIFRTRRELEIVNKSVMIMAAALVFFALFDVAVFAWQHRGDGGNVSDKKTAAVTAENKNNIRPDVYYIILDAYANNETLKALFNYDNKEFTDSLKEIGFIVNDRSLTNYARTYLSLSSSLNLKYLEIPTDAKAETVYLMLYRLIRDNEATRFLRSQGYRYIHFSSGWDQTDYNKLADANVTCGKFNEFWTLIFRTTPLNILDQKFHFVNTDTRARILCTFSSLAETAPAASPKFIFAHITSPHAPYVFGSDGEEAAASNEKNIAFGDNLDDKELYLGQLKYLNKLVLTAVDNILARSKQKPIIIIQSDHGSASSIASSAGWENPTDVFLKERMRNFMAVYAPQTKEQAFSFGDVATPVNLFRLIFNYYFGAAYEILPEKNYYSTDSQPFNLIEVTDKVKIETLAETKK